MWRLRPIIEFAYNIKPYQLSGGPGWIRSKSDRYDIEAKVEDSLVEELQKLSPDQRGYQMRLMLRSLLADRFKLSLSHETKELPIFALVVAKGGPKLTPTAVTPPDPSRTNAPGPQNRPFIQMTPAGNNTAKISATGVPIGALADRLLGLPDIGGRPVLDQTGIKGNYDFTLQFAIRVGLSGGLPGLDNEPTPDASGPSIFTALEEQLGLKLESKKGPVETFFIDHIERPSEN